MSAHESSSHNNTLHSDHDAAHVAESVWKYKLLFGGLLALTLMTVAVSYVNFGTNFWNFVVGLAIASLKAGLVAAVFMHLWGEKFTIWRFLIFTGIFVTGLFALSILSHSDPIPNTAHATNNAKWHTADSISDRPAASQIPSGH